MVRRDGGAHGWKLPSRRAELKATAQQAEKQAHVGAFEQGMYVSGPAVLAACSLSPQPAGLRLGDFMPPPRAAAVPARSPLPATLAVAPAVPRPVSMQVVIPGVATAAPPPPLSMTRPALTRTLTEPLTQVLVAKQEVVSTTAPPPPLSMTRPALTRTVTEPLTRVLAAKQEALATSPVARSRPLLKRTMTSSTYSPAATQRGSQAAMSAKDIGIPLSRYTFASSPVAAVSPLSLSPFGLPAGRPELIRTPAASPTAASLQVVRPAKAPRYTFASSPVGAMSPLSLSPFGF
eukprot:TRINITY_DN6722_c0_g1_i3.p1 TRINITY_DN6722_c0_g1~~TRINITY_DN6722_c0_g1_i3.p1  ORF type:complete len:318 (+),score=18.69 TRINITY_DN6722_c0_g1_i3:83-955(+)